MEHRDLEPGDLVQLSPEYGGLFGGRLLIVTEGKSFGCQGYIVGEVPGATTYKGKAYVRPTFDKMEYIGQLVWEEVQEEEASNES